MAASVSSWQRPIWTSTKVPSNGRARRTLSETCGKGCDPFGTFGDMQRRQRGARDVADVAADLERARRRLADELREPARAFDIIAIGFAILQDVDPVNAAARL